jgi:hypothetical protein
MKVPKSLIIGATAIGVAGSSFGVASAATTSTSATAASTAVAPSSAKPIGGQRADETLLAGDALAQVTAAAAAEVAGGTVVRVETDADGHAKYEAHMKDAHGNPVIVYLDGSFHVVSTGTPSPR